MICVVVCITYDYFVLQCLSNAQPLREYFVGEGTPYKRHLHLEENPLGSGGAIAEAYGMLMQHMWSGKATSIKPQQMKVYMYVHTKFNVHLLKL